MEKDYLPELQPGEPALSQSQKDRLFERAYERYYAKVDKVSDQTPNMYFTLLVSIGTEESKTILSSQHAFYHVHCEQNSDDSDVLAIIISKTHYAEVSGDNPLRKYNMRAKKEMEFVFLE